VVALRWWDAGGRLRRVAMPAVVDGHDTTRLSYRPWCREL
jgi:hypothetical protein